MRSGSNIGRFVAIAIALPMGFAAAPAQAADIAETIAKAGQFQTLVQAIEAADFEELAGEGPWTVFAPTDDAFEQLPEGALDALLDEENREQLRGLLAMHVVEGREITPDGVGEARISLTTMAGDEIVVDATGEIVRVAPAGLAPAHQGDGVLREATVIEPDIQADNGVIHAIDAVLVPQDVHDLLQGTDAAGASREN